MLGLLWYFKYHIIHIILPSTPYNFFNLRRVSDEFVILRCVRKRNEWHSRILQRNFLLGLSFELLQAQGFSTKADKSILLTMLKLYIESIGVLDLALSEVKLEKIFEPRYVNNLCLYIRTTSFYGLYIWQSFSFCIELRLSFCPIIKLAFCNRKK